MFFKSINKKKLGSYNGGKISIQGRFMARTWSLLAEQAFFGQNSISVSHDPIDMVCI